MQKAKTCSSKHRTRKKHQQKIEKIEKIQQMIKKIKKKETEPC